MHSNRRGSREIEHVGSAHSPGRRGGVEEPSPGSGCTRRRTVSTSTTAGSARRRRRSWAAGRGICGEMLTTAYRVLGLDRACPDDGVLPACVGAGRGAGQQARLDPGCWPSSGSSRRRIPRSSGGYRCMPPISGAKRSLRRTRAMSGSDRRLWSSTNVTTLYFETDEMTGSASQASPRNADSRDGELWRRGQKKFGDGGPVIRGAGSRHKSMISS